MARLLGPCSAPGCGAITNQVRCPAHRRGRSALWPKVRRAVLAAAPRCAHCGALAVEVDHITPLADNGAELDPNNLQPLCRACHAQKTAREA